MFLYQLRLSDRIPPTKKKLFSSAVEGFQTGDEEMESWLREQPEISSEMQGEPCISIKVFDLTDTRLCWCQHLERWLLGFVSQDWVGTHHRHSVSVLTFPQCDRCCGEDQLTDLLFDGQP